MEDKDRLGTKLHQKEQAEESRYFAERDRELLDKMKEQREAEHEEEIRVLALNRCPKCGVQLTTRLIEEVEIDECEQCQGMWLDKGELEAMSEQKGTHWVKQFFDGMGHILTGPKN